MMILWEENNSTKFKSTSHCVERGCIILVGQIAYSHLNNLCIT